MLKCILILSNSSSEYSESPKFKTQILHLHGNEIIWSILAAWMLVEFIEHIFRNISNRQVKNAERFFLNVLADFYALIPINFFVQYSTVKNIAFHDSDLYT